MKEHRDKKTPIAIFAYNRPDHVRQLFESMLNCRRLDECDVVIFCDGPQKPEHEPQVMAARSVVDEFAPRLNAQVVKRQQNLGLSRSVVSGVTEMCAKYGCTIALEDDLILHPALIDYFLQSLDRYADDDRVAQVAGFTFPMKISSWDATFFLPLTTSWGWATWERAWKSFSWDLKDALKQLTDDAELRKRFELNGAYPYSDILLRTSEGTIDSWAIRWYWQTFIQEKLTLYPRETLVWQNGFDESATHTTNTWLGLQTSLDDFRQKHWHNPISFPDVVQSDEIAFDEVKNFLRPKTPSPFLPAHLKELLKRVLTRLVKKYW